MFQTKAVEKIKTHILCSETFFSKKCLLLANVEEYCTVGQSTDDSMTHAYVILNIYGSRHTLRIRNTYCFFTATTVTRTRLNVTSYVHCL